MSQEQYDSCILWGQIKFTSVSPELFVCVFSSELYNLVMDDCLVAFTVS